MYTTKKNRNENGSSSTRKSINHVLIENLINMLTNINESGHYRRMNTNSFTKKLGLVTSILEGK